MTAQLWVGPAACGRTSTCIKYVRNIKQNDPLAAVMVILPDRLQAAAFRRRMAEEGGALGVEVGTFGDFYREILRSAGETFRVAADAVQLRVLRVCIEHALDSGALAYYRPIAGTPGFLKVLHDRFSELQLADLSPDGFSRSISGRAASLGELSALYSRYRDTMQQLGWEDRYSLNQRALSVLREDPQALDFLSAVYVDGFESFNPSQAEALALVTETSVELVVTLPGSLEQDRRVFERFGKSIKLLQSKIKDLEVRESSSQTKLPLPFAHLEQRLFERDAEPFDGSGAVSMVEARSLVEEARAVLRWIKSCHVRKGIKVYDCAVIVPEIDAYRPLLAEAAGEFGIPLQFTGGEALIQSPPIAALLDVLNLPLASWQRQLVINCLRSPYLDFAADGFEDQDADLLEAASLYGQVVEGLEQWEEALERLAGVTTTEEEAVDRMKLPNLPHGRRAEKLLDRLKSLVEQYDWSTSRTTHDWVFWLEDLLDRYRFFESCEEGQDRAAALKLRELLRAMVLAEQVAGSREDTFALFTSELRTVLEAAVYQEKSTWKKPAVRVLTMLEARGLRFKAAAVMGLAEGVFPGVEREDAFLSEEVRRELGLEPRLERAQEGLFYLAVTRADRFLLLSRPTLAGDGETWEASPYWDAVSRLLQEDPHEVLPGAPMGLAEAASDQEFLFRAVLQENAPVEDIPELKERWEELRKAIGILAARQRSEPDGVHEGDLTSLTDDLGSRFGPGHIWSASRLELYAKCPLQFLAGSLLQLERREPPEPGLDAAQLGSLLHAILEQAYQDADDPSDPVSVLEILRNTAARSFEEAPEVYGFRPTAYWDIEKARLYSVLEQVVEALGEQQAAGGWEPYAYEAPFGMKGVPPVEVSAGGEEFLFRGLIDRVDRRAGGEVCVIDYKTGSSHLTLKDYVEGWRLQLPLYALAADGMGLGITTQGMYWALMANKPGRPLLGDFKVEIDGRQLRGLEGAVQLVKEHTARIIRSIRGGRFQPQPPDEGCPAYCPAAGWCWRYKPGRWA